MDSLPESDREGDLPHPREVQELYGHDEAARVVAQAFASGRVPTAWLIGGPRGVGKATFAYHAARTVLSGAGTASTEAVRRQIVQQTHADLLVLRRPWDEKAKRFKQTLPVEEVRRIHGFFGRHAGAGAWRVCIVDTADDLNLNAANALLKTLEEPPKRALFLILAHAPARLLPTLRSRCRRLLLKPLEDAQVADLLADRLQERSPEDRLALARLAEGCPGRALALAEGGGLELYRELGALLGARPDPERVHALAERLGRNDAEQDYHTAIELLTFWLTRLVRAGAAAPSEDIVKGEGARMAELRKGASLERWVELWENVRHLVARADAVALDRRQVLLSIFAGLERLAAGGSPDLLLERI